MNFITRIAASILLTLLTLTVPVIAQQKRPAPKPQSKAIPAPTPAPTFETLVPADSYTIYGEVRGVGQFIRSNALNDLLEPVLKLSGPPKEFKTVVKWLNAHSEDVMTSRLLVAAWPTVSAKQAPETLIAIEFASAEEATKFAATLNDFLPTVIPTQLPEPKSEGPYGTDKSKPAATPEPGFHLQRMGSLIVITPRPWTMKQLKPAGSKLLAEDTNFRVARNRFSNEPLFVYLDTKAMEKEETDRQKLDEERRRAELEQVKREQIEAKTTSKKSEEPEEATEPGFKRTVEPVVNVQPDATSSEGGKVPQGPDPVSTALTAMGSALFDGESNYPEGVAFALSFEGDSFDLRALLVNQGSGKADAIPFVPMLITGPALSPEAPNIFPADTELLATMSLDLPQIYAAMSKPPQPKQIYTNSRGTSLETKEVQPESPFAAIEQRLKISLKDDLLPLLGSEVALRLPMKDANIIGMPGMIGGAPAPTEQQPNNAAPVLAIAVKDKERLRELMPKLIDALGFKGASSLMQTERREDTELVSFGNMVGYAFVGNFIVISSDVAATRYVVDSYLKHETLSSDIQFKNSTRWQPRPLHGQLYISPALMEGFKIWAQQPSTQVTDQVRAFLTRASSVPQPITYSLSNEGIGPLHELHIPRNLVLMAVAGISGEVNPPPTLQNERLAMGLMYTIVHAEGEYQKKNAGAYGTLEELITADMVPKDTIEKSGYKFELIVGGDKFQVSAVPVEYGKTGRLSLFLDNTNILRGGDKSGASASASDPPIN